ncbi:MAG: hypothetical protein MJK14_11655, partial [Rivularia sp. ALOHA_DT_140]|nr:hypothetical protein [Rivularia sp. ALOHA_DT_140]
VLPGNFVKRWDNLLLASPLGMVINLIVTLIVSRLTPPPPEIQALVEDLRSPIVEEEPTMVH